MLPALSSRPTLRPLTHTTLMQHPMQPRTLKKLVLFVGEQDHASGRWAFDLNPGLSWHDVSLETKMRLKTLPQETVSGCVPTRTGFWALPWASPACPRPCPATARPPHGARGVQAAN